MQFLLISVGRRLKRPLISKLYDAPERTVRGLKDRPTRSRGATRPPTRSRVPWTRRTSPLWGRSPPSTSHSQTGPPRTGGAGSSAPGGESGRTLRGGQERKATELKGEGVHPPLELLFFPPPGCFSRLRLDTGAHTYTSPAAPRFFPWSTSSPSSHARPHGPGPGSVALHERRRFDSCPGASLCVSCCLTHPGPLAPVG